jgi:hypothetical protein
VATAVLLGAAGLIAGALQLLIDDRSGGTSVVREPSQVVLHAVPSTLQYTVDPL